MSRIAFASALSVLTMLTSLIMVGASTNAGARTWNATQDLADGPGKATTVRLCSNCHGMDRVIAARRSNKEWITVVEQMVTQGAQGSTDELNETIDYLTDQYGKPVAINTATAADIVAGLGLEDDQAAAIVAYRAGHPKFATWKDVAAVPGVDAKWIERRQKNLTFGSVTVPTR